MNDQMVNLLNWKDFHIGGGEFLESSHPKQLYYGYLWKDQIKRDTNLRDSPNKTKGQN